VNVGALELGGSHISGACVDLSTNAVGAVVRVPLGPQGSRSELLNSILHVAATLGDEMTQVGFAAPGPFDYKRGICMISGLRKLEGLFGVDLRAEIAGVLPKAEPRAIRFVNDAEAFLIGEARGGAASGHARAMGVTLGTGLGSAFLAGGAIVRRGVGVPPGGELYVVPFRGRPVEDTISGRGLSSTFGAGISGEEIARMADCGDEDAIRAFARFGEDLGEFLAPWCADFKPTSVVFGGSIARAWSHFGSALTRALGSMAAVAGRLDEAALLGAAQVAGR
jgi:glucokinase